ncbi:sphingosine kinase 1 isoform X1 [Loxodonta africana]|uniref:sphingosine kinase 1 isoform X1 n=1 Tax=Loxodonta africana TaxID=9785 RepID=UPI000540660E|nr:sphingosine kinase 1 isoform X1 [Loxodonta africana]XP_010595235.1 sphingosine kinase 1 isoform X1 [Loxodonta africana]
MAPGPSRPPPPSASRGSGLRQRRLLSDPAAAGNDAGAPTAPALGGKGEPYSRPRDARLGSTDKELKAGAAATGSSPTALGIPWQREPGVEVMDPAGGPQCPRVLLPRPCRVLVLLNPRGGKGKALQLFRSHVQPLLVEAEVSFTLLLTEWRNHARELVRHEELGRWDALVVMSGDGLMHEVVNGLMERPDWETAIRMPLCSLPAGSANALAASVNHYSGYQQVTNEELLINCTLLLCRRLLSPMNLLSLHTASGLHLFSVLSLAWGFVADVDLESEKYRRLGEIRFTFGTFLRLISLRTYQGRLAYLPVGGAASRMPTSPALGQGGPANTLLVPLDQPVPDHWTVVPEEDFVLVLALLHSHLGSNMFIAPMGRCAAGVMHLFYVRAGVSRTMLLRLFLAMEKGRHMEYDCPHLVYVPVVAFRLEPKDRRGMFAVDGELMVSEPVQGQVHPDCCWMVSGCVEPSSSQGPRQMPPQPL